MRTVCDALLRMRGRRAVADIHACIYTMFARTISRLHAYVLSIALGVPPRDGAPRRAAARGVPHEDVPFDSITLEDPFDPLQTGKVP
jgi:hypothetical protein